MASLVAAPVFQDEEWTQRARVLFRVVWLVMGTVTVFLLAIALVQPAVLWRSVAAISTVDALGLGLLWLNTKARTTAASWMLVLGLIALVTVMSLQAGGIRSPGVTLYFVFVLMGGVLLGLRQGVLIGVVCVLLSLGLVALEGAGRLPTTTVVYTPSSLWLLSTMYIGVVLVLLRLATDAVSGALSRARTELAARRAADRERDSLLYSLNERVKELRVLHEVTQLVRRDNNVDQDLLRAIAECLPQGWQYPASCMARVVIGSLQAQTANWTETPWRMEARQQTTAGMVSVEVGYAEEYPAAVEGPFLAEERQLINSITELIATHVQGLHGELRRRALEEQMRQSQKMEALGTLASGIAHDFNNILTAVGGNVELAQLDLPEGHQAREALDEIGIAHARATDLVRRILTFARKRDVHKTIVELPGVVDEALFLLKVSTPKSVRIEQRYADGIPHVLADATQIHQIVMNLGTNAVHAMQADGGTLSITLDAITFTPLDTLPSVDLRPGHWALIQIGDTGTGIPPEVLNRLFEPFFTTKGEKGTGLGLSMVHGIVKDHGGAITVESVVGTGTTFAIYLPAA
jgi:signal transduction histidine kinase